MDCILDFETRNPYLDLTIVGSRRYAEDVDTEILCLRWTVDGNRIALWRHGDPVDELVELVNTTSVYFIPHNAGFEKDIWHYLMVGRYGLPPIPRVRWQDTMAVCAMKAVPQKLEKALKVFRIGEKDKEGSEFTRALSRLDKKTKLPVIITKEAWARVYVYCENDVRDEWRLHQRVGPMPAIEAEVWRLSEEINERGVALDMRFVQAAQRVVNLASVPLVREFGELTGGLKPTQRDKVLEWVNAQGVGLENLQKGTLDALLGSEDDEDASLDFERPEDIAVDAIPCLPGNARRALAIRRTVSSASIKKLARMAGCVCANGRVYRLLAYHAASTGRWGGRLIQPQNFPRGVVKVNGRAPSPELAVQTILSEDPDFISEVFGAPAIECVLSFLRHAIVAGPGRLLCVGDFAAVEARLVLALSGQHDKCELLASGADVYLRMAEQIFNKPEGSLNKEEHAEERQTGKNTILGCGFQMGWQTFQSRYCADRPDEFAKRAIDAYRQEFAPAVPKLWAGLEAAALRAVHGKPTEDYGVLYALEDGWLTALLPSGRKLWYFQPEPGDKAMPWSTDERPDIRPSWSYWTTKKGRWARVDAYGGLLTENVVQALARDQMVHAMKLCKREGLPVILTVHDEIVTEPETAHANPRLLAEIMKDRPRWAEEMKFPVAAECWVGPRYRKG